MRITTILKTAAAALACVAVTASAQSARPFKGVWYSPDMYIEIDFHGQSIPDPEAMDDGETCAGVIKVKPGLITSTNSMWDAKVSGKRATATTYLNEDNQTLTFELLPDGGMKVTSAPGFAYLGEGEEGMLTLPSPQILRKASPFAGEWKLAKGDGKLTLNLHNKCIYDEAHEKLGYGTIYVAYNQGMYVDDCIVTEAEIDGNRAVITYTGSRSGNDYRATLVYDPATRRITVKNPAPVTPGEDGECYVTDGLVFGK